jgi:hypothetical protein
MTVVSFRRSLRLTLGTVDRIAVALLGRATDAWPRSSAG